MRLPADSNKHAGKRKILNILVAILLVFFVSLSFVFMAPQPARADLPVVDILGNGIKTSDTIWVKIQKVLTNLLTKVAAGALQSAVSNTLNTIAFDEATYLGSGREGQKPLWETGDIKTIMSNVGDQAAGSFISSLDKQFGVNLCSPNLSVKLSIGLGLVGQVRPPAPDCTWSQLSSNWDAAIKKYSSLNGQGFLKEFAQSFDVTGGKTDLSAAFSVQEGMFAAQGQASFNQQLQMQAGSAGLMLDNRNIAGTIEGTPGQGKTNAEQTSLVKKESLLQTSKDDLVSAAKVFINQLAITGMQTIMKKFTQSLNQPAAQSSITNPYAAPQSGGLAAAQGVLHKIIEPSFNTKADYDILQQLSVCNAGVLGGVGPNDCVIDSAFSQAISNRQTVGETFANDTKPFGFTAPESEPSYTQGYPYRSMSILRKYRIIPVGWELAAQYINTHFSDPEVANHNKLQDLIACYDPNDLYPGFYADWCRGLIDPTWVLKAPQNYCTKEGYGPQVLSAQSVSGGVDGNGNALQSQFQVVRSDSYCGDEQSCIKENDDGSCYKFGYCTEDKRLWKFGASGSCDAQYNTCQTFTKASSGAQVSYLKNTLQFCSQTNAGCQQYAIASADGYSSSTDTLDWTKSSDSVFLNAQAKACDQSNEGCHEFMRFASGLGTNLIIDSNFVKDTENNPPAHWSSDSASAVLVTPNYPAGQTGLVAAVNSNSQEAFYSKDWSVAVTNFISAFPEGFVMEPEVSYTLSAEVYLQSGSSVTIGIGRQGSTWKEVNTTAAGWQPLSVTLLNNSDILANEIRIYGSGSSASFYVTDIKFEVGSAPTAFSTYYSNNLVNEKFMPAYLQDACYTDAGHGDFSLRNKAPAICNNFARQCNRDEAGCDSFTNNDNPGLPIPAAITEVDACPQVCDGYNTFIQSENDFSSAHVKYLIPSTAQTCSEAVKGCREFTNLASSTAGGEQKEYYSHLRQCVRPADPGVTCGDYYAWEGSGTGGQQLVKYNLEVSGNGTGPQVTSPDSALCSPLVYGYNPFNPAANADCRQFYDNAGHISYHLYSRTVSCSSACSNYRLTQKDKLDNVSDSGTCATAGGNWDDAAQACYACKNGGTWDGNQGACVYRALKSESTMCSAADNGCSEYNGNGGANTQTMFFDDFEGGTTGGWGGHAAGINTSAYVAGTHSFQFSNSMEKNIGATTVVQGSSYVLTFLAKTDNTDVELGAEINNQTDPALAFDKSVVVKAGEWRIYSLSLPVVSQTVTDGETLTIKTITGSDQIYIDNIQLVKISDRYFLIDGSWKTPASCDQDTNHNPYPLFALGCASYNDHLGVTKYLHSFDRICQPSAVGCEAIIDTQNTASADADVSHGATTTVPADRVIYARYDQSLFCGKPDQGCQRLGLKTSYGGEATYQNTYLLNNANNYGFILCGQGGVGCDLYNYTSGNTAAAAQTYFKDPGNQVCEWRQSSAIASNNGWGWYKKKVTRCNGTDNVCASNADCSAGSCILETTDTPCPTDKLKTIGTGGLGNEVSVPTSDGLYNWAGLCPSDQSSCTEYIDPVSSFSGNVVANSDFVQHIGSSETADSWSSSDESQNINLEGGTLYVLTVEGQNTAKLNVPDGLSGAKPFHVLKADNTFDAPTDQVRVGPDSSDIFYTDNTIKKIIADNVHPRDYPNQNNQSTIILRKAIVNYHLSEGDNGVDKSSCTQGANPSAGCVYFNERSVLTGTGGFESLANNIDPWKDYGIPNINAASSFNLANGPLPIKVNPDRDCAQWLACKSYIKDENSNSNVCFDIANCNRLDDSGNCANFTVLTDNQLGNRIFPTSTAENLDTIKNLTGYVRVGYPTVASFSDLRNIPSDLLNPGAMSQIGKNLIVPNGDFELSIVTSTPINAGVNWIGDPSNWTPFGGGIGWTRDTADSMFAVISDPQTAQNYGFYTDRSKSADTYPMIGKSFLRYNATTPDGSSDNFPVSDVINVQPGQDYYLSFYVDTFGLKDNDPNNKAVYADIRILDSSNNLISAVQQGYQDGWELKTQKFTVPLASKTIKLLLAATANSSGNVYVDDFEITPVLLVRQASSYVDSSIGNGGQSANIPNLFDRQTCRLFPQENSLSCEYTDSAGILQKGDRGYCLQYDSAPGDPNACLLWWPIDQVKGAGIQANQAVGYDGRSPLYYCTKETYAQPAVTLSDLVYETTNSFSYAINPGSKGLVAASSGSASAAPVCTCSASCVIAGILGSSFGDITEGAGLSTLFTNIAFNGSTNSNLGALNNNTGDLPLDYGTNVIQVTVNHYSDAAFFKFCSDSSFPNLFSFSGRYHYLNVDQIVNKDFDFGKMYGELVAQAKASGANGPSCGDGLTDPTHPGCGQKITFSDGSAFQVHYNCGNADNDNSVSANSSGLIDLAKCSGSIVLTYTFNIANSPACAQVAQVVDASGRNDAWTERVRQGSSYDEATCNKNMPAAFTFENYDTIPPLFISNSAGDSKLSSETIATKPVGSPTGNICASTATTSPFGSANPPAGNIVFLSDPSHWKNPLPYWSSTTALSALQGSMGQLYAKNDLSNLFAQSLGIWDWIINADGTGGSYQHAPDAEGWTATTARCANNVRPACYQWPTYNQVQVFAHASCYVNRNALPDCLQFLHISPPADTPTCNCAVAPTVANFDLNGAGSAYLYGRGFVNLTFNSTVDPEQAPLASYSIDWGDGTSSVLDVSGANMNARPPGSTPHSAFHAYDYYDLLNKYNKGENDKDGYRTLPTLFCDPDGTKCTVKPRVKIVDNWGWCSEGVTGDPCPITNIQNKQSGHCMSAAGVVSLAKTSCWSDNTNKHSNTTCTDSSFPYCGDGWYESGGQIIVYKQ